MKLPNCIALGLRRFCGLAVVLGLAAGCSGSSPETASRKPVHPVKGQVTVQGKPAAGANVMFVPKNEPAQAVDPRPRAEVQADGSFVLFTYDANDGAPAGDYLVSISWPDSEGSDRLKGRYTNPATSRLTAKVKEGDNELPPFALK